MASRSTSDPGATRLELATVSELMEASYGRPFRGSLLLGSTAEADALIRGRFLPSSPLDVGHLKGSVLTDLLGTGWAGLYLISERFVNLLKSNSIGGWSTFPVRITDKRGAQVPGYLGLSIVGHCGSVLQDALVKDDGGNMTRTKGFYLDPSLWDGSDIFMPDNYRVTLVVKTAREIIARGRLSNVAFEPATFLEALPSGR